jgi:Peptidase family M28
LAVFSFILIHLVAHNNTLLLKIKSRFFLVGFVCFNGHAGERAFCIFGRYNHMNLMKRIFFVCLSTFFGLTLLAQNQPPVIVSIALTTDVANNSASVQYSVTDEENDPLEISLQWSVDAGKTFTPLTGANVTGDVGFPVSVGNKSIACTGLDFSQPAKYVFRVIADDRQPFDIESLVQEVDSNRLRQDLQFIEGIRHRTTGLAHLNATRDSLQHLFEALGLSFRSHTFSFATTIGQNLVGSMPGTTSPQQVVIVDAHYDTVSNAPGADDNGSGTVGMMEVARLLSRYPSKKTQRYIGFDLEEAGLVGSSRYVANTIPPSEQVEGVFNFEMIGYWSNEPNTQEFPNGFGLLFPLAEQAIAANQYRGDFITNVGNTASQSLALLFSNSAQQFVPDLKVITLDVPGTGTIAPDLRRSDHAPFWDSGRKALMLTDGADFRNECYHTPGDTLQEKLNFTFMSNVVKATLAAMAQLVEIQHGDWAAVAFEKTSNVATATPCGFTLVQNGAYLRADRCLSEDVQLELYDLKGSLLSRRSMQVSDDGLIPLAFDSIAAGVYVLTVRHASGTFAQKIVIP